MAMEDSGCGYKSTPREILVGMEILWPCVKVMAVTHVPKKVVHQTHLTGLENRQRAKFDLKSSGAHPPSPISSPTSRAPGVKNGSGGPEKVSGVRSTHLGEEPPPLPIPQLEVGGTVPLNHLHGCQLLLPLGKGPGDRDRELREALVGATHVSPCCYSILPCIILKKTSLWYL